MDYPPIAAQRAERLLASAGGQRAALPDWYLRRWHFHPDGYLSRAGVRWYDRVVRRLYNWPSEGAIQDYLARLVVRTGSATVVDAGCGSGRLLAALASRQAADTLYGVDLSPVMLSRARAVAPADAGIVLRHADLTTMDPINLGGSVDVVVLSHVLGHVPAEVAEEISRRALATIATGGYVVTVDHAWHPAPTALSASRLLKTRRFRGGAINVRVYRRSAAPGEVQR